MHHRDEARNEFDSLHVGIDDVACVTGRAFSARQNMKRQRHLEILGGGPEWIVIRMRVGPVRRRIAPDHRTGHPAPLDSFEFSDRSWNVLKSDKPERNQSLEIVAAIV